MPTHKDDKRDFFQILDIPRDASDDNVKKAWRKKVREFHPDVRKTKEAEEETKLINIAYEALKSETGRRNYIRELSQRESEEKEVRRPTAERRPYTNPVRVNDFVNEEGEFDFYEAEYWMRILKEKGYPDNEFIRNLAEGTARFHEWFGRIEPGINLGTFPGLGTKTTAYGATKFGTYGYFRNERGRAGVIVLGLNNATLLSGLVLVNSVEGEARVKIPQRESLSGVRREVEEAYRRAGLSYEIKKTESDIGIAVNPLQALPNLQRMLGLPKAKLDFSKVYKPEGLWGIRELNGNLPEFLNSMRNIARVIAVSDASAEINTYVNFLKTWEGNIGSQQILRLTFASIESELEKVRREGGIVVERTSGVPPEYRG